MIYVFRACNDFPPRTYYLRRLTIGSATIGSFEKELLLNNLFPISSGPFKVNKNCPFKTHQKNCECDCSTKLRDCGHRVKAPYSPLDNMAFGKRSLCAKSSDPDGRIVQSVPGTHGDSQYHGHMAPPTFGRKYLVCFYCNKKSGIKYDGLIAQWECARCGSMNFLDEVRPPNNSVQKQTDIFDRMAISPTLQLLPNIHLLTISNTPFLVPILHYPKPSLKAPTLHTSAQHVFTINTSSPRVSNNTTSRSTLHTRNIKNQIASTLNTAKAWRSCTLRSAKTVGQRSASE